MSKAEDRPRRGRGRPRLDPGGDVFERRLTLTPTASAQLDQLAELRGESRSAAVRWAIDVALRAARRRRT